MSTAVPPLVRLGFLRRPAALCVCVVGSAPGRRPAQLARNEGPTHVRVQLSSGVVGYETKVLRASQEKKKESYYAFRNQESFVQALITRDIYPLSRFVFHFVPYMIRSTAGDFFLV